MVNSLPSHFTAGKETHIYVPQMTSGSGQGAIVSYFEHRYKPFNYIRCRENVLVENLLGFQDALWSTNCGAQ